MKGKEVSKSKEYRVKKQRYEPENTTHFRVTKKALGTSLERSPKTKHTHAISQ